MFTVDIFKAHFARDFPYLPDFMEGKAYFKGDVVYVEPNFYQSLIDANLEDVSNTQAWALIKDSTDNYLTDVDIMKAYEEAKLSFNTELFQDGTCDCNADEAMLYLVAYYLVVDIKNSSSGLNSNAYSWFLSGKSVGNVHETYSIPAWVSNNPSLSLYLDNGYGKKYLTFLLPRITGFFYLAEGGTTIW